MIIIIRFLDSSGPGSSLGACFLHTIRPENSERIQQSNKKDFFFNLWDGGEAIEVNFQRIFREILKEEIHFII